jgi:hypothetical protein
MSVNISNANITAFLNRVPQVLEAIEEKRIVEIFGSNAYVKKQPGKHVLYSKPI